MRLRSAGPPGTGQLIPSPCWRWDPCAAPQELQRFPGWYYNLKAQPECQLGDEKFIAREVTDPDECARLYALAERVYAGYADYRVRTAHVGRQIPIFRLKPQPGGPIRRALK